MASRDSVSLARVDAVSAFIRQGNWDGASEGANAGWWGCRCDTQPHLSASGWDGGTPAAALLRASVQRGAP